MGEEMAYILYFLGFVAFYRLSEKNTPDDTAMGHFVFALIWPLGVMIKIFIDLSRLVKNEY